jgi:L-fucose mutarotase
MLRNIDPLLSPDLLRILAAMGHGDEIVIADANFPGDACARRLVRLDGIDAVRTLRAVLSIMPLDSFVDERAMSMAVVDDPGAVPPVVALFQSAIDEVADHPARIVPVERFAFYDRSRAAYAVIQTGETRLYGNVILKKGVIFPSSGA